MKTFDQDWIERFGSADPIGWVMRTNGVAHWLRFHALPESKPYAENERERRTYVDRANELAAQLMGEGGDCWIVAYFWCDRPRDRPPPAIHFTAPDRSFDMHPVRRFYDDDVSKRLTGIAFAAPTTWDSGTFDRALLQVADEETYFLWFSPATGNVFSPYHGGFDLFLADWRDVDQLRKSHSDWLPAHPSEL